jgi:hypothetical protein
MADGHSVGCYESSQIELLDFSLKVAHCGQQKDGKV